MSEAKQVQTARTLPTGISQGLTYIGLGVFLDVVRDALKADKDSEIIEFGAGSGTLACTMGKELDKKVTTIDHDPEYKADWRTTTSLIKKRPMVVGKNTILVINWSNPNEGHFTPGGDFSPFKHDTNVKEQPPSGDVEAIHLLKPKTVIAVVDMSGSAGSNALLTLLSILDPNRNKDMEFLNQSAWAQLGIDYDYTLSSLKNPKNMSIVHTLMSQYRMVSATRLRHYEASNREFYVYGMFRLERKDDHAHDERALDTRASQFSETILKQPAHYKQQQGPSLEQLEMIFMLLCMKARK